MKISCEVLYLQDCDYGIDWSGPVSSDDDSNTTIVPDLPSNFLTEHQRILLTEDFCNPLNSHQKVCTLPSLSFFYDLNSQSSELGLET